MSRTPIFLLLLLAPLSVNAAFTRNAQWKLDTIERTFAGTCFRPGPSSTLVRECANATLKTLLDVHTKNSHGAGLSIAYYDPNDGGVLGGASWADWDAVALPAAVCMSGRVDALDDAYTTTCRFTVADDDHDAPSSHEEDCSVSRAQDRVTDGCYTPPPRRSWLRLDDSTSGILTILGLILAFPVFGMYRRCRARRSRQPMGVDNGQVLPLVAPSGNTGTAGASMSCPVPLCSQG